MKRIIEIFVSIITVLLFLSCEIREEGYKPDTTKAGKDCVQIVDEIIIDVSGSLDKALKVYNYSITPDSLKETERQTYLINFGVTKFSSTKWYLKQYYDTAYTVMMDGKSIYTTGAEWIVKKRPSETLIIINCIGNNIWKIKTLENKLGLWNSDLEFTFKCTDSDRPKAFEKLDFSIIGKGVMKTQNYSRQEITLDFEITDSLKRESKIGLYKQGIVKIIAKDIKTKDIVHVNARFEKGNDNRQWVTISTDKYTNTYKEWYNSTYYY